jgi:hypothetical protein
MSKTNPPAFPQHGFDTIAERFTSQGGMTIRDYFAAKAMQSFTTTDRMLWSNERMAAEAYDVADAMLQARDAK